jgi:transcriptional regulator with XRE-family HTH domain
MHTKTRRTTTDAVEVLRRRYVTGDPEAEAVVEEMRAEAELARTIYRLRTAAKLTQQDLARRVGTTASVISRLEDADYAGHSLAMLRRIAAALGRTVEIRFPAAKGRAMPKPKGTGPGSRAGDAAPSSTRQRQTTGKTAGAAKGNARKAGGRSSPEPRVPPK